MNDYIRKIKKLFQTGFFHIFGSSVLNKIISFLSSIVLVRILTKGEYGIFTYAWNIYSIVLLFNGLGMESSTLQVCSERSGDTGYASGVFHYGLKLGIKFDIVLAFVLVGVALFAPLKIGGSKELLLMLCLLPMVQFLYGLDTSYLRSQKRNRDFAKISLMNTALVFCVSVCGAIAFREKGMVLGYYAAYAVSVLAGYFGMEIRFVKSNGQTEQAYRRSVLSIGFVTMCNNGIAHLLYLLDVFVLGIIAADETVLASYKVATIIPTALTFIPLAMVTYLYPYFAEHRQDGKWCLVKYRQVVLGLGLLNACISTGLIALAPFIVQIFFGAQYIDAVPIFRILAANYFFSGTFRILSGNLLVTQRKLKFNFFVAVISGVVNVIADLLFIQWWGAIGAAVATVIVVMVSSVMNTVYLVYTFKKMEGSKSGCY